ncbi:MAG: hypothetical protein ABW321_06975, partial [Polyangiales bacterium]
AAGKFREDLFYRLEGVSVRVPPLRERLSDLPRLIEHFAKQIDPAAGAHTLSADVLAAFAAHHWPGNVRELRNAVRRVLMLPDLGFGPTATTHPSAPSLMAAAEPVTQPEHHLHIGADVLPRLQQWRAAEAGVMPDWLALDEARRVFQDAFELDYLAILQKQSGGVKARAAALAGVSRQAIQKLVRKHGLDWRDSD